VKAPAIGTIDKKTPWPRKQKSADSKIRRQTRYRGYALRLKAFGQSRLRDARKIWVMNGCRDLGILGILSELFCVT